MPKLKTHRGAAKRFKRTGSGKLSRRRAYAQHNFSSKTAKRKRRLRKPTTVGKTDHHRIDPLLPYD